MRASPSTGASILLVGDGHHVCRQLADRLRERGYQTTRLDGQAPWVDPHRWTPPDLVVVAPPIARRSTDEVLSDLRAIDTTVPIVVTGSREHLRPEQLQRHGLFDCVLDPLERPHRLLAAVGRALGIREEDREASDPRTREASDAQLLGEHPSMRRIFEVVEQVCARTTNGSAPSILVTGETGTGKGALAKAIHSRSTRRDRSFVAINCAALPANLVEAELFGYERGAFTDAGSPRPGLFETADGGTLFLDEIASVSLDLQSKLLTVIEDKQVRRIGARQAQQVDVQLIAAAQPSLRSLVGSGVFREDLFHRLNVVHIDLPPLRHRGDDGVLLANRFLDELCREYGLEPKVLTDDAADLIRGYHWPGNVRELRNQIERIVLLSEEREIAGRHFEHASDDLVRVDGDADDSVPELRIRLPASGISLLDVERRLIRRSLELHEGNVAQTARYLSITRQTLVYRMKKFGITRQSARS